MKRIFTTLLILLVFTIIAFNQRVTVDFEEYATGFTLSNQASLTGLGISFPNGIEVVDCSFSDTYCKSGADGANSGNKLGLPAYVTEFTRETIILEFAKRQDSVTFYLKPAYNYLSMQVSLEGWVEGGEFPTGGTTDFNDDSFKKYKFTNVDEIRIYASSSGSSSYDNWIVIDDISFDQASDVEEDTTDPYVYFSEPSTSYNSEDGIIPLNGYAYDNVQLDTVEVFVFKGDDQVYHTNFCGRAGVPCPIGSGNYPYETTLNLSSQDNGTYTLMVRAVDVSGNENTFSRDFTITVPDPPPAVSVHKIEINQAVQDKLFEVDGPGTVSTATSSVPLLPERNTLIRYYLKTTEGTRYDYSARLKLTVFHEDGTTSTEFLNPNLNGFPDVDSVIPVPSSANEELEHLVDARSNLSKTLNFVVAEDLLVDADLIALTLFEGIVPSSGQLQVNLAPPTEFVINYYKIKEDTPDSSVFMDNIGNYIEGTYPISRLHQKYEGEVIIHLGFDLIAAIAGYSEASRYRRALGSAIGGRWPSLPSTLEYNYWRVILGVMHPGAGGNATRGNASDRGDRIHGIASTSSRGNVGAHEAGHLIGLKHAGKAHGECGGGGCETFVNVNGTLEGDIHYRSDFGIALKYNDGTGVYDAFLIDPCPVADPADRIGGCTAGILDDAPSPVRPFDFMSYGEPPAWGGFLLDTRSKQWISTHNYKRIYRAIQYEDPVKIADLKFATVQENKLYMQINGVIKDDSAYLYGILEKPISQEVIVGINQETTGYQLILNDNTGELIHSQYFQPDSVTDLDECCALSFNLFAPKANVHEIIIKDPEGKVIYQESASINKPTIKLNSDLGGNNYTGENLVITWEANDPDDDPLIINIEYSPDMGKSWIPLALLEEPDDNSIVVDASQLPKSDSAIIKVLASDGIHNSVDVNEQTFCIKSTGQCEPVKVDLEELGLTTGIGTRVNTKLQAALELYPNPSRTNVNLNLTVPAAGHVEVAVLDLLGKTSHVKDIKQVNLGKNLLTIDINHLSSGMYHVVVKLDDGQKLTKRLMVY